MKFDRSSLHRIEFAVLGIAAVVLAIGYVVSTW